MKTKEIKREEVENLIKHVGYNCLNINELQKKLNNEVFKYAEFWLEKVHPKQKYTSINIIKEEQSEALYRRAETLNCINNTQNLIVEYEKGRTYEAYLEESLIPIKDIKTTIKTLNSLRKYANALYPEILIHLNNLDILNEEKSSALHPITILMGKCLPELYEEFFDRSFGTSSSNSSKDRYGPGVRFVQSVLSFMSIKRSGSAIKESYNKINNLEKDTVK